MYSSTFSESFEDRVQSGHRQSEEKYLATSTNLGTFLDSKHSISPSGSTWSSVTVPSWNEQPSSSLYIEKESKEKIIIINQDDNLELRGPQGSYVPLTNRFLGLKTENQIDVYNRQQSLQHGQQYRQQQPLQQQPVRINVNTSQYSEPSYAYTASSERVTLHPARVSINFPSVYRESGTSSVVFAEDKSQTYFENTSQNAPLITYPRQIRTHQSRQHFVTQNSIPVRSSMVAGFHSQLKDETEQKVDTQSMSLRRTSEMPFRRVHYINSKPFFEPLNQSNIIYSNIPFQPWETELRVDNRQHLTVNELLCSSEGFFEGNSESYNDWKYDQRLYKEPNPWMLNVFDEGQSSSDGNYLKYVSSCSGEKYEHCQAEEIQDPNNHGYYTSNNHYQQAPNIPYKAAVLHSEALKGDAENNMITNIRNSEESSNDKYLRSIKANPIEKFKSKIAFRKIVNKNIQRVQNIESLHSRTVDGGKEISSLDTVDRSCDLEYIPSAQIDENQKREELKYTADSRSIDYTSRNVFESTPPNQYFHPDNKETIAKMAEISDKESVYKEIGRKMPKENKADCSNEKDNDLKNPISRKTENSTFDFDANKTANNDTASTSQKLIEADNHIIDKSASASNCNTPSVPNIKGNKMILDRISSISHEMKAHQLAEWNAKCVYDVYKEVANVKDSANKYLIPACLFFGGVISGHPLLISEILRRRFCFKMYLQNIYNVVSCKRPEIPPDCPPSCYMKQIKDLCEVRDEYTLTSVQKILPLVKKHEIQTPGISQQWAIAVLLIATKITNKTQYDITYKKLKPFIRTQLLINSYQKILRKRMNSL